MDTPVTVSIICLAYKHEKYIRQCLDGFVMQKTNFAYEVCINDDASPDGTADIIREYERKYPDIIRPVYQTENQYSKNNNITINILFPMCRGKYIAYCEGDDFWTDPEKLQRQVDALEANPDCNMCVCKIHFVNEDGSLRAKSIPEGITDDVKLSQHQSMHMMTGLCYQFSGCMMRQSVLKTYYDTPFTFRTVSDVGDEPLFLYLSQSGPVYILNREMSCYRVGSIGSWATTTIFSNQNVPKIMKHFQRMISMCDEFDSFTQYEYHTELDAKRLEMEYNLYLNEQKYRILLKKRYRSRIKPLPTKEKIKLVVKAFLPAAIVKKMTVH